MKRQSKHVYFMNSTCQCLKLVLVETKLINMFKTWSFSKYESLRNTLLLVRCNWLWLFRSCCVSHVKSESNEVKLFSRVSWLSMFLVRLMCAVLFHLLLHNHPMTCFCGPVTLKLNIALDQLSSKSLQQFFSEISIRLNCVWSCVYSS